MSKNSSRIQKLLFIGLFITASLTFSAQAKNLVGIVRDAHTKSPLSAVKIEEINTRNVTTTDEKGHFELAVSDQNALLKIIAIEYNVREVSVRSKNELIIDLYPNVFSNAYDPKTGLNGEIENTLHTNTISTLNYFDQSTSISPEDEIQKQLAGEARTITRSAATGMGTSIFIRGLNSLNANTQPLYIVDGVIRNNLFEISSIHDGFFSNPLSNIEMSDIQSISVLKDGTAIYGSKGANGVVLITTKRGSEIATKINLNVYTGMTEAPKTIPVMGANAYKVYLTDILGTAGLSNTEINQLPYLNDNPARSTYNNYHNNTLWSNEIYQTGYTQNYNINVNGGDDKALYFFSLGYLTNQGNVKNNDFQKYNMRLNADLTMSRLVKLGINIGFARSDRNLRDDGVNSSTSPTWLSQIKAPILSPYTYTFTGEKTTEPAFSDIFNLSNPIAILSRSINTVKQSTFNVGLNPSLKINADWTLNDHFDYYLNKSNEDFYRPYQYSAPELVDGVGLSYNVRRSQVWRDNTISNEMRLKYEKQIAPDQHLTAIIGNRYLNEYFESDFVEGHNSMSNSVINLRGSFKNLATNGMNDITKSMSNYVNADYNLKNRYILNASVSMDASSRFGSETKGGINLLGVSWGLFPAINGAWIVSSEEFMKNINLISNLKLKAGYEITGNDDIANYQTSTYFSAIRFKGISNGMIISNIKNPQIQWESTNRAHAGIDMGLFNDRVQINADVYSSLTNNLLVRKNYPDVAGLGYYWANEGSLSNKGFEVGVNIKMLNLKNFKWEMGVNAGHYKNKIESLPNGEFTTKALGGEILSRVGQSAGVFYGYKTTGVFATEAEAKAANLKMLNGQNAFVNFGAGDAIFEDISGPNGVKDGIINEYDKQIIGNPNPDIYGSYLNKFTIGHLTVSALITYSYGNDVYNYPRNILESGKDFSNQTPAVAYRWTGEGQITNQPKAVYGDPMGNSRFSNRWIEDGSYVRLKTVSVSYDIPLKSSFLQGLNIWASANNLLTLTKYLGADPEFSYNNGALFQGIDAGLLPLSKNYYLGVKINL